MGFIFLSFSPTQPHKNMTKVTLKSKDEKAFVVEKDVACMSTTIKNLIDDIEELDGGTPIPVPYVSGPILEKVIQYCEYHLENPVPAVDGDKNHEEKRTDDIIPWDAEFSKLTNQLQVQDFLNDIHNIE